MPKIRVEHEVPRDCCDDCQFFDFSLEMCNLFDDDVLYDVDKEIYARCNKCKQAEVEE